jgi:hypothetical protein
MNLENLSSQEKRDLLDQLKQEENQAIASKHENYEALRNFFVENHGKELKKYHELGKKIKEGLFNDVDTLFELMKELGTLKQTNKGSITIYSDDKTMRIRVTSQTGFSYDERSSVAKDMILEFMEEFVKPRSIEDYNFISTAMSFTKFGSLTNSSVATLIKAKRSYTHKTWLEAITLLEQSKIDFDRKTYIYLDIKDQHNKWEKLELNFAKI